MNKKNEVDMLAEHVLGGDVKSTTYHIPVKIRDVYLFKDNSKKHEKVLIQHVVDYANSGKNYKNCWVSIHLNYAGGSIMIRQSGYMYFHQVPKTMEQVYNLEALPDFQLDENEQTQWFLFSEHCDDFVEGEPFLIGVYDTFDDALMDHLTRWKTTEFRSVGKDKAGPSFCITHGYEL